MPEFQFPKLGDFADCESSQIHSHQHVGNCLVLRFHKREKGKAVGAGKPYFYPNVTPEQYADFIKAKSQGSHFIKHFKHLTFHQQKD